MIVVGGRDHVQDRAFFRHKEFVHVHVGKELGRKAQHAVQGCQGRDLTPCHEISLGRPVVQPTVTLQWDHLW